MQTPELDTHGMEEQLRACWREGGEWVVVTDGSFIPEARCIGVFDASHPIEAPIQPGPIVACGWAVSSTWADGKPPGDAVQGGCKTPEDGTTKAELD